MESPSRVLVDYSDIINDDDTMHISQQEIEDNMKHYLVKSGKAHVKVDNQLLEIEMDEAAPGLWRQNAMTLYETLTPYLIVAREFGNNEKRLFYLVKCKNYVPIWAQVSLTTGDNIYNIRNS